MESRPAALINLPEKAFTRRSTRQRRTLAESKNSRPIRPLRILHGRLPSPEMAGRDGGAFERLMWTTWLTNPAGRFHGGDEPPPSTWAAVVLSGSGAGGRKQGSRGINLFAAPSGRT